MDYSAFNVFARGYSHIQNNVVCQDASYSCSKENHSIIVVADGHGSKQYCRSHKGSQLAVQCAADVISSFVDSKNASELICNKQRLDDTMLKICNAIIARWHMLIEEDIATNPFTDDEISAIPEVYADKYKNNLDIEKAYGTTLIAVFTLCGRCFGIQIGDGKCVAIYKNGYLNEPIPWDENCCFNITTSLCDINASEEFRFAEIIEPIAVFIGTDGIDDSYGENLGAFYMEILNRINEFGYEQAISQLSEYMSTLSEKGSHDDVSISALVNRGWTWLSRRYIAYEICKLSEKTRKQRLEQLLPDKIFQLRKENLCLRKINEEKIGEKCDDKILEEKGIVQNKIAQLNLEIRSYQDEIEKIKKKLNGWNTSGIELSSWLYEEDYEREKLDRENEKS